MRNFFLKNLIFQKISIEVVIKTFSEFLMLVYGLGFFVCFFFLMQITSWEVDLPAESVTGLEPLNCPRIPCSTGMGGPRAAWSWSSTSGMQEAAWGGGAWETPK